MSCNHSFKASWADPGRNSKLTYAWEQYLFHYVSEGEYTFLVMADDSVGRYAARFESHDISYIFFFFSDGYRLRFWPICNGR